MAISITGILFIATGFCGIIALISYHIKRLDLYRKATKFKGPLALPVIGNALFFLGNNEDILRKAVVLLDSYPSPFALWVGSRLLITVYDAENLKIVLQSSKCIEKDYLYKFTHQWIGTGLISAPADKWRIHRKLIQPTFNKKILESFVEVFAKQSKLMTKHMKKELNKGEFDIFDYVSLCTLDIICETSMGVTLNAQTRSDTMYTNSLQRGMEIIVTRIYKIWLHSDFIFNLTKLGKDHQKYVNYVLSVTNDVIQKKKRVYKENTGMVKENAALEERSSTKKVFLDLLMDLTNDGAKLTDKDLSDEVNTMIIAANDTTATVNSFVMTMLANFPEVQEKVFRELCEIYGDEISSDTPVKKEDLNRMEYLERVIKETMRLFPPLPLLARSVTEDIITGDYTLPKGSTVVLGIMKLHRWEKYWPDPMKFDPDRFLPEEVARRHPYCYLPFSGGPRNCLGIQFAMMAMKTLLATVLRRYVLKKDKIMDMQDIKLTANIVLKPAEKLSVKIVERKYDSNTIYK